VQPQFGGAPEQRRARFLRLRPMDYGDLLDFSIKLYMRRFPTFVAIWGVVFVPLFGLLALVQINLLSGAQTAAGASSPEEALAALSAGLMGLLIILGVLLVGQPIATAALTRAVSEAYLGRSPTLGECYAETFKRFTGLLGAILLRGILLTVGFLLLIVPGVYLSVAYLFIGQIVMLENSGGYAALRRSAALVRGYWVKAFVVMVLVAILTWVVSFVFSGPGYVLDIVAGAKQTTGPFGAPPSMARAIYEVAANAVANILVGPFAIVATTLLYYDLRVRKEGFDLQVMAQGLGLGEEAVRICPHCGAASPAEALFCSSCGASLSQPSEPPPLTWLL